MLTRKFQTILRNTPNDQGGGAPPQQPEAGMTDTGDGHLVGTDPKQPPRNAAEWGQVETAVSTSQQQDQIQLVDDPQQGQQQVPADGFFTREDIERVRSEEKDKLYGRIQSMSDQLETLTKEREEREREEQEAIAAAAAAQKAKEEEEMELRDLMERRETELRAEMEELRNQAEAERAIYEKERALAELDSYRQARIEQEAEYIMPQLRDLISGSSTEEIDSAIEDAKQRTAAIMSDVRESMPAPQTQRGVAATAPPVGPMENASELQSLSPEDIRTMDMEQYRKHRDQLVQAASAAYRRG